MQLLLVFLELLSFRPHKLDLFHQEGLLILPSLSALLPTNLRFLFSNFNEAELFSHLEDQRLFLQDGHLIDFSLLLPVMFALLQGLIQLLHLHLLLLHLLSLILEDLLQLQPLLFVFGQTGYLLLQDHLQPLNEFALVVYLLLLLGTL